MLIFFSYDVDVNLIIWMERFVLIFGIKFIKFYILVFELIERNVICYFLIDFEIE